MAGLKIWEIDEQIDVIEDYLVNPETGEILTEEEARALIDKLEIQKDKKIEFLCKLVVNKKAEAEALRSHKADIDKKIKSADRTVDTVKNYLQFVLSGNKWKAEDGSVSVSYRTTKDKVIIDDLEAIPDDFFKKPHTEGNLSKTLIKEMVSNGTAVPGTHLEDSVSVIIK